MRRFIIQTVTCCCLLLAACFKQQQFNKIEFEPHLDKAYQLLELYGVGFEGYNDPKMPSNAILPGWKKDASTRCSVSSKLVNIGEPKAVLTTRDGSEKHLVPLKWVGEVPPSQFNGKIFIRIYSLEEGLIHWKRDAYSHWDYKPD